MSTIQFENVISPPGPKNAILPPAPHGENHQRTVLVRRDEDHQIAWLVQFIQEASEPSISQENLNTLKAAVQADTYAVDVDRLTHTLAGFLALPESETP